MVYQVVGWNLYRGRTTVSERRVKRPDFYWFNAEPILLAERRGPDADHLIDRIEAAVKSYPYPNDYRVWPGPNSNSFTAFVARKVPELGLDLPPTAIGKDFLAGGKFMAPMPSGSGWQLSLLGLLGIGLAREEGIEINILGLSAGIDVNDLGLRLPGIGRITMLSDVNPGSAPTQTSTGPHKSPPPVGRTLVRLPMAILRCPAEVQPTVCWRRLAQCGTGYFAQLSVEPSGLSRNVRRTVSDGLCNSAQN
jgi:hypothetical protein